MVNPYLESEKLCLLLYYPSFFNGVDIPNKIVNEADKSSTE